VTEPPTGDQPTHPLLVGDVADVVREFDLCARVDQEGVLFGHESMPWTLRADRIASDSYFMSFFCRTLSGDAAGDRSDLHDLLSHFAACYLRKVGRLSSQVIDVPHPFSGVRAELYACYVVPDQPSAIIRWSEDGEKRVAWLLYALAHIHHLSFHEFVEQAQAPDAGYDYPAASEFAGRVAGSLGEDAEVGDVTYGQRSGPDLRYFRSARARVAVIESERVAATFAACLSPDREEVRSPGGDLHVEGELGNFESRRSREKASHVLRAVSDRPVGVIPLENSLVTVAGHHVVFVAAKSGRTAFERERDRLRSRHDRERSLIFPPARLRWADRLDPERFEALARDLLEQEPGVMWVRRAGPTRQGDGGRDLICERVRSAHEGEPVSEDAAPTRVERVVVQCKAIARTVGKGHVRDIRDTLDLHESHAYLLVVATQVSETLARFLDQERQKGRYAVDWWTRTELDERLLRHRAVLARYGDLVREVTS
jgi:hypothetical protein